MKQLFLSPKASETAYANFKSTLANGVPYERVEPFLSPEEKEILKLHKTLYIWGCQPGQKSKWDQMSVGDIILFYAHKQFTTSSNLLLKKWSDQLALELWPKSPDTDQPWSGIYIVNNLQPIDLSLEKFNEIANYKFKAVMGFQPVTTDHLDLILSKYGNLDNFINAVSLGLKEYQASVLKEISTRENPTPTDLSTIDTIIGTRDIDEVLQELSLKNLNKTPEEQSILYTRLKRDHQLVKLMKEKNQNKCQICGFTFKTKSGNFYSEAAHIKPLSSREAGIDRPENIIILCPNHHKMLDYGVLDIDQHKQLMNQEK